MRSFLCTAVAIVVVLGFTWSVRADEEARKVIDKAIKAHGGAETLAKLKDKATVVKAKMKIFQPLELEATLEMSTGGKKFRQNIQLSVMGMDIAQSVIFDGKELWIAVNGKIIMTLSKEEELKAIKEQIYSEEVAGLALLGDKKLEYSIIGEDKVNDIPVVGVRVTSKGHKDVNLYFDKQTGLLAKVENRGVDFQSQQEVADERIMSDYKEFDGQKRPMKVVMNRDGKKFVEIEFTDIKIVDKLDDNTFDKP